jgi:hypothetical protein
MRSSQYAAPRRDAGRGEGGRTSWGQSITEGPALLTSVCVQGDLSHCLLGQAPWVVEGLSLGYKGIQGAFEELRRSGEGSAEEQVMRQCSSQGRVEARRCPSKPLLPTRNPPIGPVAHPPGRFGSHPNPPADRGGTDHRAEGPRRHQRGSPTAVRSSCRRTHLYPAPRHVDFRVGCRGGAIGRFRYQRTGVMQDRGSELPRITHPRTWVKRGNEKGLEVEPRGSAVREGCVCPSRSPRCLALPPW